MNVYKWLYNGASSEKFHNKPILLWFADVIYCVSWHGHMAFTGERSQFSRGETFLRIHLPWTLAVPIWNNFKNGNKDDDHDNEVIAVVCCSAHQHTWMCNQMVLEANNGPICLQVYPYECICKSITYNENKILVHYIIRIQRKTNPIPILVKTRIFNLIMISVLFSEPFGYV